jgi:outer membrane protein OmpA-like peptidoglycan-associated protein
LHYSGCSDTSSASHLLCPSSPQLLNISVVDKATKKHVKATIDIIKNVSHLKNVKHSDNDYFHFIGKSDCSISVDIKQSYSLQVSCKGYIYFSKQLDFLKKKDSLFQKVELEKIEVGKNFMIDNIHFHEDLAKFLPSSTPALEHLLNFMKENPTVKIEIQGHANLHVVSGTTNDPSDESYWTLSTNRAKAVYDYLIRNHIQPSRMTYKGYGTSRMLYPDAPSRTPEQEQLNRRVEIVITSY